MTTPKCSACGKPLTSWDEKHAAEDCAIYRFSVALAERLGRDPDDLEVQVRQAMAEVDGLPELRPAVFRYRGRVYVRPVMRGFVLLDLEGEPQLVHVVPEGDYEAVFVFYRPGE